MIIKIDYNISSEEIWEILSCAFDNDAIDYWAETLDFSRGTDGNIWDWKIREWDSSDGDKQRKFTINYNTIERGLKRILNSSFDVDPQIKQWIFEKEMDATCYDCIIQAGLYNEIIYGQENP